MGRDVFSPTKDIFDTIRIRKKALSLCGGIPLASLARSSFLFVLRLGFFILALLHGKKTIGHFFPLSLFFKR